MSIIVRVHARVWDQARGSRAHVPGGDEGGDDAAQDGDEQLDDGDGLDVDLLVREDDLRVRQRDVLVPLDVDVAPLQVLDCKRRALDLVCASAASAVTVMETSSSTSCGAWHSEPCQVLATPCEYSITAAHWSCRPAYLNPDLPLTLMMRDHES